MPPPRRGHPGGTRADGESIACGRSREPPRRSHSRDHHPMALSGGREDFRDIGPTDVMVLRSQCDTRAKAGDEQDAPPVCAPRHDPHSLTVTSGTCGHPRDPAGARTVSNAIDELEFAALTKVSRPTPCLLGEALARRPRRYRRVHQPARSLALRSTSWTCRCESMVIVPVETRSLTHLINQRRLHARAALRDQLVRTSRVGAS